MSRSNKGEERFHSNYRERVQYLKRRVNAGRHEPPPRPTYDIARPPRLLDDEASDVEFGARAIRGAGNDEAGDQA